VNCAYGGQKLQVGASPETYICNGATGATGAQEQPVQPELLARWAHPVRRVQTVRALSPHRNPPYQLHVRRRETANWDGSCDVRL